MVGQKLLKSLDLFSGIGGFALAAEMVGGIETTQFVEINPYCQKVLNKNFPQVPIHPDIKTYEPGPGHFDIVCGGSPCQDLSAAGKQKGIIDGDRSSLWFEQLRIYKQSGATFLVWENVMGAFRNGFREVLRSLSEGRYDAEWQTISAAALGAPHLRERIFLIAYPNGLFREASPWSEQIRSQIAATSTYTKSLGREDGVYGVSSREQTKKSGNCNSYNDPITYWAGIEPPVCGVDAGLPNRMDRLTALGNTVVPQCAAIALQRVLYLNSLGA
jgi:DNA (cytosine-5)-methyltransferase 1